MRGAPRPAGPDREVQVRAELGAGALLDLADAAEDGAADDLRALLEGLEPYLRRLEPQDLGEVDLEDLEAGLVQQLARLLGGVAVARAVRVGEQALLLELGLRGEGRAGRGADARRLLVDAAAAGAGVGRWLPALAGALGFGRSSCLRSVGGAELVADLVVVEALRHGVALRDAPEVRVGVPVAVDVLKDDEAAELAAVADLLDDAVVGGDHRSAAPRVDVDRAAVVVRVDDPGRVVRAADLLAEAPQVALREVVRVARRGRAQGSDPGSAR